MGNPFSWSFFLMRPFGINVRVHVLFPFVAVALILRAAFTKDAAAGIWVDAAIMMGLLFVAVLLHELGHCLGARLVDGDASEVMLWPLGGLASVEVPHTWGANLITAAAGPLANIAVCLVSGLSFELMTRFEFRPPLYPFWPPFFIDSPGTIDLYTWQGVLREKFDLLGPMLMARFFWVNWVLFLINVVLIGFPLDGGRIFQCLLWPRYGFRQATVYAIYAGFVTMFIVGLYSVAANEVLALCLALFIYVTCRQQWIYLEGGDEALFGYDFTQGYTSLERDQPAPKRKRPNFWQRWRLARAQRRMQREQEQREAEERRADELLDKVHRSGVDSLTDEERRFLKRFSDRYRNRQ